MRLVLFVAFVAIVGCGKKEPSPPPASAAPPADPVAALRDADEQAAFSIDAACASIEDALAATKRLAPIAGGDAKEALLDVAEMLDSAGATLADHNEPPPPLDNYRKEEAERATERQKAAADALDALKELRDARGTLDDLAANVPAEHSKALEAIGVQNDEAIDAVESGITHLGGKVPPEEEAP